MIGKYTDCPVEIWALMFVEGDGVEVFRTGISKLFASREAAVAELAKYPKWMDAGRLRRYVLNTDGQYIGGDW